MAKVTGPTTSEPQEPFVEVAQDSTGWHWQLWSGNGRAMARSTEPYKDQKHAVAAVRMIPGVMGKVKLIVRASE